MSALMRPQWLLLGDGRRAVPAESVQDIVFTGPPPHPIRALLRDGTEVCLSWEDAVLHVGAFVACASGTSIHFLAARDVADGREPELRSASLLGWVLVNGFAVALTPCGILPTTNHWPRKTQEPPSSSACRMASASRMKSSSWHGHAAEGQANRPSARP